MADVTMAEPETDELLATRRSRRSTAGNRMEAALAEMAAEATPQEAEDDVDFTVEKYEEDLFESDFESTDEEAAQEEANGEDDIRQDENKERRAARVRLEKATAAAHKRQAVTFNLPPGPSSPTSTPQPTGKPARRVSLGSVVNAETGEVIAEGSSARSKRQSQRSHTRLSRSAHEERLKKSEQKASQAPRRSKHTSRSYTQAELIARALDNEEGNIHEHKNYLKVEEEKRKRARVIRASIDGPVVRWISRIEDEKVTEEAPPPPSIPPPQPTYSYRYSPGPHNQGYGHSYNFYMPPAPSTPSASTSTAPNPQQYHPNPYMTYYAPTPPPPKPIERIEKVTKNYVIHDNGKEKRPSWSETMTAVFGDHEKWDEAKVYPAKLKGRPLSRPKQVCPITGRIAPYCDPRTGVPYADIGAFKTLTGILQHEYVWNAEVGCYVSRQAGD